jgi:hypothetical protein
MDMQHRPAWTYSINLQHGHAERTFRMDMKLEHATWTNVMDMQCGHVAWDMQPAYPCFFFILNIFIQLFVLYNSTTGIPDRSLLFTYIYIASIGKDDKQTSGYLGNLHVARELWDIAHHKTYPNMF